MPDMTPDHKRDLAAVLLELDDSVFAGQVVPDPAAPHVLALLAGLGAGPPMLIELRDDHLGLYGWPADGVQARIEADGGTLHHGWRLREWSSMLLVAERHAVWRQPDGAFVDITTACTRDAVSLFAPDGAEPADGPRFLVLHVSPDLSDAIADRIAVLKGGQRAYEERRAAKAGLSLHDWVAAKWFTDPLPAAIPAFAAACEAFIAKCAGLPELIEPRPHDHDDIIDGPWHPDYETEVARDRLLDWHVVREERLMDIEDGIAAWGLTDTRLPA